MKKTFKMLAAVALVVPCLMFAACGPSAPPDYTLRTKDHTFTDFELNDFYATSDEVDEAFAEFDQFLNDEISYEDYDFVYGAYENVYNFLYDLTDENITIKFDLTDEENPKLNMDYWNDVKQESEPMVSDVPVTVKDEVGTLEIKESDNDWLYCNGVTTFKYRNGTLTITADVKEAVKDEITSPVTAAKVPDFKISLSFS